MNCLITPSTDKENKKNSTTKVKVNSNTTIVIPNKRINSNIDQNHTSIAKRPSKFTSENLQKLDKLLAEYSLNTSLTQKKY